MTCQEMMELMQRDLDQDLTADELAIMLDHLDQCPDCADLYTRLQLLSNELAQLPRVTPPYSIVDAILPQLEGMEPEVGSNAGLAAASEQSVPAGGKVVPLSPRRGLFSWKIFSGVAAAGIVLGMFLFNHNGQNDLKKADIGEVQYSRFSNEAAALAGSASSAEPTAKDMDSKMKAATPEESALAFGTPTTPTTAPVPATAPPKADAKAFAKAPASGGKATPGREVAMAGSTADTFIIQDQSGASSALGDQKPVAGADTGPSEPGAAAKNLYTGEARVEPPVVGVTAADSPPASIAAKEQGDAASVERTGAGQEQAALTVPKAMAADLAIQPLASPDGKFSAEYRDGSVAILTADGKIAFTSAVKLAPGETVMFIKWKSNTSFDYSITSVEGSTAVHRILLEDKKETVLP